LRVELRYFPGQLVDGVAADALVQGLAACARLNVLNLSGACTETARCIARCGFVLVCLFSIEYTAPVVHRRGLPGAAPEYLPQLPLDRAARLCCSPRSVVDARAWLPQPACLEPRGGLGFNRCTPADMNATRLCFLLFKFWGSYNQPAAAFGLPPSF
jgi:hypothetical protein